MHRQGRGIFQSGLWLCIILLISTASAQTKPQPKRATFEITNTFTVKVPDDAKHMRIWFAVPQKDAESEIQNFEVAAPHAVTYGMDSQGNQVGYVDIRRPQGEQVV